MKSLLSIIIMAGVATGFVLYYLFPATWFPWYPVVPSFFVALWVVMRTGNRHYNRMGEKKMIIGFMVMRGVKIGLTLCFILLYYWLVNVDMTKMVLTTSCFYLLYLIVETYVLYRNE